MPAGPLLWEPARGHAMQSHMYAFLTRVAQRNNLTAPDEQRGFVPAWEELRTWALTNRSEFWEELVRFASIEFSTPPQRTCDDRGMLETKWFPGARLNYARHLLRNDDDAPAIIAQTEQGRRRTISHHQLRAEVARCAAALRAAGVQRGDRVAGFMPNIPETVIAMLAAASIGAIWSSCSPDFGVRGVLDRFGQIAPAVLFAADGYHYGGKRFELLDRIAEMLEQLPSVRKLVAIPALDANPDHAAFDGRLVDHFDELAVGWRAFLGPADGPVPPLTFDEVPFDHPLFIMYSSGTTGVPKCIVHGHGGTLVQHMKELMLHSDLRAGDRIFYYTTCGWMMWNWLVSGLGTGAAIVLFDGSPTQPAADVLWDMAARLGVTHFGTSPKFLAACQKLELRPGQVHDLSVLRCVLSTGSPLSIEQFVWVYENVKRDVQLSSISGGTDIISCFMLGNPLLPVYAGEIQCRGLAMDVQAWSADGHPVLGEKGELVCVQAFPSQPVGFWNDPDGSKYRKAYFEHFPGVWRHGDYIEITDTGGIIVYGRSDATLNPGGVRIGTAEIYRLVESIPEVADSVVTARRTNDDEEICLFVVLRPGLTLDDGLVQRIRDTIAAGATKRHVPRHIRQVDAVPYTISGKKVELAVQQILHGEEVKNRDALANPDSLAQYRDILKRV
jgi:acetoacetyl-CoA synthetase